MCYTPISAIRSVGRKSRSQKSLDVITVLKEAFWVACRSAVLLRLAAEAPATWRWCLVLGLRANYSWAGNEGPQGQHVLRGDTKTRLGWSMCIIMLNSSLEGLLCQPKCALL